MRELPIKIKDDDYIIELNGIKKAFGVQQVLSGVDLKIRRGETMVVIGASGGGKSVILKHCIGLLQPDKGEVVVNGTVISSPKHIDVKTIRKNMGMLFQGAALFDSGDQVLRIPHADLHIDHLAVLALALLEPVQTRDLVDAQAIQIGVAGDDSAAEQ